ncbi:MAG: DUF3298 domain-containing protein [Mucilaginibacter polytrichastri]|nr:DUF3298 domain-containing protein [Mucilaginibacter polytrichastri]
MKYTILIPALLLFAACGQTKNSSDGGDSTATGNEATADSGAVSADPSSDTLTYSIESILKQSKYCNSKGTTDTPCMIVALRYPKFPSANKPLNDSLSKWLAASDNPDKSYSSPEAYATGFVGDYETFYKEQHQPPAAVPWEMQKTVKVYRQKGGIVPLMVDSYVFQGGAHGSPATVYHNWDTKSGKELELDDLLNPGWKAALTKTGEQIFRKQENLSAGISLSKGYFFDKGVFSLNGNFLITEKGLQFLYNPYEIKPYAAGKTELLIPYTAIASLIKKDGPLTRFQQ